MAKTKYLALVAALAIGCGSSSPAPKTGSTKHHEQGDHQPGKHQQHGDHDKLGEHAKHGDHKHGEHHVHGDKHKSHDKHVRGHRFKKAEDWAKRFDDPKRDAWQKPKHVVSLLGNISGATVADIGAGTGYFVMHLAPAVGGSGTVLGLDIEADMVRYMTERAAKAKLTNVKARKVSPTDPGLAAASVDRVLIVNTWHHVAQRVAYGKKLAAALKPGGMVFIVDFTMDSPYGPPKHHRLEASAVLKELTAAGLEAKTVAEELPYQYVIAARVKP